jgi:alanyl aminopeptidase
VEGNDQAIGYYRVTYRGDLLKSLTDGDVEQRLSAPERVDLMGDVQALSSTGKIADAQMLSLVPKFHDDPSRYVVERAISMARSPREHLVPDDLLPNYQRFILKNFQRRAHELGWMPKADDTEDTRLLRPSLLSFVATAGGDQELAKEARALADKWLENRSAVPAEETAAVLETAAYYGDKALFDRFLEQFKQAKDRQEKQRILRAMTQFRDPAAIQAGMDAVLHGDVPFIEGQSLLYAGQQSAKTRHLAFDFMKEHIDELASKRPSGGGADAGARFVQVGSSFCDAQSQQQLKNFFEPRVDKFVGAPRLLAQTLERINNCIANKSTQEASVEDFLKGY